MQTIYGYLNVGRKYVSQEKFIKLSLILISHVNLSLLNTEEQFSSLIFTNFCFLLNWTLALLFIAFKQACLTKGMTGGHVWKAKNAVTLFYLLNPLKIKNSLKMAYMANYQEEPELVAEQLREVSFLNLYFDWTSIQNMYPAFQVWAVNCFLPIPTLLLDRIFTRLYTCKF